MQNENYFSGQHVSTLRSGGVLQYGQNVADNSVSIVYTVAADYELLLANYFLTGYSLAFGIGSLMVYNATPALIYYLDRLYINANGSGHAQGSFKFPLIIPATYTIRVGSNALNCDIGAGIIGHRFALT